MSFALKRYTGNGTLTNYTIPFTYRTASDVVVTVAGTVLNLTTHYSFPSASTISFVTAPANGAAIVLRRNTSQTSRIVDYAAGSVLKEADLDNDSIQAFNMAQEAIDIAQDSIAVSDSSNQFDATSLRVTNVADPTSAQDATTKNYVDTASTSQVAQADAAKVAAQAAQTAAETAETNAETAETNAETAETNAETAQTAAEAARDAAVVAKNAAETAETNAETAKTAAETAETNAETAETNAETAETNASTSATLAGNYANKVDGAVESSNYSSKAWALGGTGVTDTAGSGSSKEWATDTSNQVDGTEYSAKEYAIGTQAGQTSGSAKQWSLGGGNSFSTNTTVDGSNYSAKYWAEQAAAAVDGFDDTYLGAKSSAPTVDNDGDALNAGDLYYNTTDNNMKVYNGSAWENVAVSTAGFASAGFSIAMSIAL